LQKYLSLPNKKKAPSRRKTSTWGEYYPRCHPIWCKCTIFTPCHHTGNENNGHHSVLPYLVRI